VLTGSGQSKKSGPIGSFVCLHFHSHQKAKQPSLKIRFIHWSPQSHIWIGKKIVSLARVTASTIAIGSNPARLGTSDDELDDELQSPRLDLAHTRPYIRRGCSNSRNDFHLLFVQ
jgi:hypothetical protein